MTFLSLPACQYELIRDNDGYFSDFAEVTCFYNISINKTCKPTNLIINCNLVPTKHVRVLKRTRLNVSVLSRSIWNLEKLVFKGEVKTRLPGEKPLEARGRISHKLNSHMASTPGFEPRLH